MRLQTVVETPAYLAAAKGVLTEAERIAVVNMVAENPLAGIPLGGGVRRRDLGNRAEERAGAYASCSYFGQRRFRYSYLRSLPRTKKGISAAASGWH